MTPLSTRLRQAESHLRGVASYAISDALRNKALDDAEACREAAAIIYQEECRTGTGARDNNNPEFVRKCGPDYDAQ